MITIPDFRYQLSPNEVRVDVVANSNHEYRNLSNTKFHGICFGQGSFDNWCVYLVDQDTNGILHAYAPTDKYYFERLYWLGTLSQYSLSMQKVYGHLLHIYELVDKSPTTISDDVLDEIDKICWRYYFDLRDFARELFFMVYYGMVAEENKAFTKLGSLIKIHGLHELLINQHTIEESASCTKGMSWKQILRECDTLGLIRM